MMWIVSYSSLDINPSKANYILPSRIDLLAPLTVTSLFCRDAGDAVRMRRCRYSCVHTTSVFH